MIAALKRCACVFLSSYNMLIIRYAPNKRFSAMPHEIDRAIVLNHMVSRILYEFINRIKTKELRRRPKPFITI